MNRGSQMTRIPSTSASRRTHDRRQFLKFLAASPYVAAMGGVAVFALQTQQASDIITDPKDALNVMDFEEAARRKIPTGHWVYMASGVDDDITLRANREGFKQVQLRPRRLVDATKVDMRTELVGTVYSSPIFLCPTGAETGIHPDGELAVARAAKARGALQMLSSSTSVVIEEVHQAVGRPTWYQLYAPSSWEATERLLRRVEAAGSPVIVLTVDNTTGRKLETYLRRRPKDLSECAPCHEGDPGTAISERPMYNGINMAGVARQNPAMTWEFVDRLRKATKLKLFIKGLDTAEDARLCLDHGVDGILVSNHGGRATETGRSSIEALPEVVTAIGGRIPVFVDGGVRRGSVPLGDGGVRTGGRRPRPRDPAGRTEDGHGQLRHTDGRRNYPRARRHPELAELMRRA
jgi:4-hydroxymandelate oxidase